MLLYNNNLFLSESLELIIPVDGVCSTGTVEYKLDEDGTYSTTIPTAVDAGVSRVIITLATAIDGNHGTIISK